MPLIFARLQLAASTATSAHLSTSGSLSSCVEAQDALTDRNGCAGDTRVLHKVGAGAPYHIPFPSYLEHRSVCASVYAVAPADARWMAAVARQLRRVAVPFTSTEKPARTAPSADASLSRRANDLDAALPAPAESDVDVAGISSRRESPPPRRWSIPREQRWRLLRWEEHAMPTEGDLAAFTPHSARGGEPSNPIGAADMQNEPEESQATVMDNAHLNSVCAAAHLPSCLILDRCASMAEEDPEPERHIRFVAIRPTRALSPQHPPQLLFDSIHAPLPLVPPRPEEVVAHWRSQRAATEVKDRGDALHDGEAGGAPRSRENGQNNQMWPSPPCAVGSSLHTSAAPQKNQAEQLCSFDLVTADLAALFKTAVVASSSATGYLPQRCFIEMKVKGAVAARGRRRWRGSGHHPPQKGARNCWWAWMTAEVEGVVGTTAVISEGLLENHKDSVQRPCKEPQRTASTVAPRVDRREAEMSWIRGPTQVVWRRRLNNDDDNVTGRSAALLSHEDESWQCAEAASVAHKSIAELWDSIKQSVDAAGIDALEKRADVANRQRQAAEDSLLSSTRTAAADVLTWMRRPTSQRDSGQERRAVVALRDRPAVSCWCGRPPSPAPHHTFRFSLFLPKPRGAEDEEADRHEHLPALCRHVRGFAVARWRGASWLPWDAWIAAACEAARVPLLLPPAAQALCWMAVSAHRSGFKKRFYWNSQTGGECAYDAEVGRDGVRDFPFAIADAAVEAKKLWQTSEAPSSLPPPPCCAVRWNRADAHRDTVSFEENTRLHALAEVRQHRFWEVPTVAGASFRKGISRPTAPRRTRRKRARSEERMEADCAADDDDDDADSEDAAVPQRTHTMYHHLSAELLSNSDGDTVAVHRCRDGAVAAGGDTPGRLRASAQETQQTQSTMPDAATSLPLQDGKAACNLAGAFPGSRASPTSVLVCLPVLGADPLSMSECRADRSRTSDTSEKEEGEKAFSAFPTFAVVREAAAAAAAKAQQRRHTRDRQALMSSLLRRSPLPTSAQCAIHTRSMSCLRRSNAEWTWQLPLARVEARCREYWRPPSKIPAGAIHSMEPVGTDGDRAGEVRASCGRQRKSTTSPAPCSPTAALPFDLLRAFVVPSPFMAAAVLGISASSRSQRRTGRVEGADARLITAGAPRVTPVVSACNHDGEGVVEPQTDAPLLLAMKRSAPLTPSQERHQARHALLMSAATDDGERISLRIPIAPTRKAAFNVRGAEAVHSFCTAHWPLLTLRNVAAAQLRQPRQAPLPDIAASAAAASADSAAAVLLTGAPNECHVDQHARVASQSVPSSPVVQIQARRRVRCRALRRAFYRHILTASTPASSQLLTAPSEDVDDPLRAPSSTWQRYRRELARGDDAELDRCVRSVLAYAQAEMCGGAFSSFYLKLTVFDADGNRNIDSNHDNAAAAVATVGGEGSVRAIQVKHHHMTSRGARLCSGSHPALSPPPCVDLCVRDINCTPSYYQRLMHTLLVDGLRRDGWLLFHTHWHDALAGCQALLSSHPSRPGGAGELLRGDTAAPTHPPFMGSVTATVDSYGHSSDACDCAASREVRWFVDSEDDDETAGNTADVGAAQLEAGLHGAQETIWSSRSEAENAERPFPILNWSGVPDDQEAAIFMTRAAAAQAAAKSARFLFFYAAGTPYNMERTSPSDIYDTAGESDTAVSVSASSSSASSNPVNGHDGSRSTTCAARAQARGDAGGGAENLHGQLRRHAAQLLAGTFPCAEGVHCANDTLPPRTSLPAATHAVECEVQPLRRRRYTRRVFSFHEEQRFLLAEARVAWETRQSARRHSRRSSTEDEFDGAGNSTAATTAVTKSSAPPSTTLLSSVFSEGDALDTAEGEEEEGELAWLRLRHRAHLRHVRTPAGPLWPHREVPHDVFSEACRSDAATHFTYMAYMLRDRRRTLGAAASARPF